MTRFAADILSVDTALYRLTDRNNLPSVVLFARGRMLLQNPNLTFVDTLFAMGWHGLILRSYALLRQTAEYSLRNLEWGCSAGPQPANDSEEEPDRVEMGRHENASERREHFVQLSNYPTQAKRRLEWATRPAAEKICPKCAEQVKAAALVCRFCGHEFVA